MVIELPYPPSVNRYWRNIAVGKKPRTLISRQGRDYRDEVLCLLRGDNRPMLTCKIAVTIEVFQPDKRRRDLDNIAKAPLDALTHAGVWLDDSQIDELRLIRKGVLADGKLIVTIHLLAGEG